MNFEDLLKIKAKRKKPEQGDVFAIQPVKGVYFFGKVILNNVVSKDSFINGMNLVYIFSKSSKELSVSELDCSQLLIPPLVVNNQGWDKGYFFTVSNLDVTQNEKDLDFGFWDSLRKKYVNLNGDELKRIPQIISTFGLGSYGVVGRSIQIVLKEKPYLLG